MKKTIQCKDIPTLPILQFVAEHGGIGCNWNCPSEFQNGNEWERKAYDRNVRLSMPDGYNLPANLVLAKMRNLIRGELIEGCYCGCRGDFEITDKCKKYIQEKQLWAENERA